jgi:hypothetical protein
MEFLLKTYNSNRIELITAASPDATETKILRYLEDEKIKFVEKLPESTGLFCVKEDDIYYIHKSFYDKGYETYMLYSLQWASWTEKQASTLTEEPPEDPPELIRE